MGLPVESTLAAAGHPHPTTAQMAVASLADHPSQRMARTNLVLPGVVAVAFPVAVRSVLGQRPAATLAAPLTLGHRQAVAGAVYSRLLAIPGAVQGTPPPAERGESARPPWQTSRSRTFRTRDS